VSPKGINGVLSGSTEKLKEYELKLHKELVKVSADANANEDGRRHTTDVTALEPTYEWLDFKYCHLQNGIPIEQQSFSSLSVKITKEVVSLFDFSAPRIDGS
jgi:predicted sulfurtransferase